MVGDGEDEQEEERSGRGKEMEMYPRGWSRIEGERKKRDSVMEIRMQTEKHRGTEGQPEA